MDKFKITGIYALTAVVVALCLAVLLYFLNNGELPNGGEIGLCVVISLIVTFGFGFVVRRRQAGRKPAADRGPRAKLILLCLCSTFAVAAAGCSRRKEPETPAPPPPTTSRIDTIRVSEPPAPTAPPPTASMGGHGGAPTATTGAQATGRGFLYADQKEDADYGMFSYLLFPSAPAGEMQIQRYKAAIASYLRTPAARALLRSIPKDSLNIFYLPLTRRTLAIVDSVLKYYDYARATAILARIPGAQQQGPYLVSTMTPITLAAPTDYLLQDMTVVYPTMVDDWVTGFKNAALNPRFWDSANRDSFVLNLRNVVAVAAAILPGVQDSLKSWIKWISG